MFGVVLLDEEDDVTCMQSAFATTPDFLRHRADDRSTSSLPLYIPGSSSYKLISTSKTFRVYSFGRHPPDIDRSALVLSHHVRYDGPASY
jgi:hypothetical protein